MLQSMSSQQDVEFTKTDSSTDRHEASVVIDGAVVVVAGFERLLGPDANGHCLYRVDWFDDWPKGYPEMATVTTSGGTLDAVKNRITSRHYAKVRP